MTTAMTLEEAHVKGFDLVREHSTRFVAYVRSLPADDLVRPLPDSDWTVGQAVAHVASVYERYTIDPRRAPTPDDVATQNAEDVDRLGVDLGAATESIEAQVVQMGSIVDFVDPAQRFPFHAGLETTLAGGWGNLLGELLAHGDDIARATDTTFELPSADLEILWRFASPLLAGWLQADTIDVDESWGLLFPFGPIQLTIDHRGLQHSDQLDPRPIHHDITIDDTAEWTLAFPYGRRPLSDEPASVLASRFRPL